MKKTFSVFLAVLMGLGMLTGCSGANGPEPSAAIAGGWHISSEDTAVNMPEEAKNAFDKAAAREGYVPLAYLGSQVVAGANYAYLCRSKSDGGLSVVKVYNDLGGNASVLDTAAVSIADYTQSTDVWFQPMLAGGWMVNTEYAAELPPDVQSAFDKAEGLAGAEFTPIGYMGSQVVAGSSYAVLCGVTEEPAEGVEEPASALAVVTIYADLSGGAAVTSVAGFSIP